MNEWVEELGDIVASGEPAVLVTVAGLRGSAPREAGAKMIVTGRETIGTIGGGQLEYQCTRIAVGMLWHDKPAMRTFPLGAAMGQCCGGVVEVLFEPVSNDNVGALPAWLGDLRALHGQREHVVVLTDTSSGSKTLVTPRAVYGDATASEVEMAREMLSAGTEPASHDQRFFEPVVGSDFNIAVFGAGHVGTAVVAALSALDCNIRWVDSRRNVFRSTPRNVRTIEVSEPALEVAAMPPGSHYLVMTHSHALDFDVCDRILRRGDARYCGLIGSISKRRRFEKRFREQGLPEPVIASLVCPIGIDGISGKKPAEIALAAAAEVLQAHEHAAGAAKAAPAGNVTPL